MMPLHYMRLLIEISNLVIDRHGAHWLQHGISHNGHVAERGWRFGDALPWLLDSHYSRRL